MHGSRSLIERFAGSLEDRDSVDMILLPPAPYLPLAVERLEGVEVKQEGRRGQIPLRDALDAGPGRQPRFNVVDVVRAGLRSHDGRGHRGVQAGAEPISAARSHLGAASEF